MPWGPLEMDMTFLQWHYSVSSTQLDRQINICKQCYFQHFVHDHEKICSSPNVKSIKVNNLSKLKIQFL